MINKLTETIAHTALDYWEGNKEMFQFEKASKPTMYFIGVTTGQSSIMKVFPDWMHAMGQDACMQGIDLPLHADVETYREVVRFIRDDPLSLGALVTTHKIDIYNATNDLFDYLDPYAQMFHELSSISKQKDQLCGHAKDPLSCGQALEEFVPKNYWADNPDANVFIMGAGGSAISMCSYFMRKEFAGNYPTKIVITNRSQPRLDKIAAICESLNPGGISCEFYLTSEPEHNDEILSQIAPHSLVINATGLGKDRPGSPLTGEVPFPMDAMVWEINYRGDLLFLHQAEAQHKVRRLKVHDGWMYFVYGWTQVISEVFHYPIEGETLREMDRIAAKHNNR